MWFKRKAKKVELTTLSQKELHLGKEEKKRLNAIISSSVLTPAQKELANKLAQEKKLADLYKAGDKAQKEAIALSNYNKNLLSLLKKRKRLRVWYQRYVYLTLSISLISLLVVLHQTDVLLNHDWSDSYAIKESLPDGTVKYLIEGILGFLLGGLMFLNRNPQQQKNRIKAVDEDIKKLKRI